MELAASSNEAAARVTLESFDVAPAATALARLVLSLAQAIDAQPGNASLARQYRDALNDLTARCAEEDDSGARLLAALRDTEDAK